MSWKTVIVLALIPITILTSVYMWQEYNRTRPIGLRCLSSCSNKIDVRGNEALLKCVDACAANTAICK